MNVFGNGRGGWRAIIATEATMNLGKLGDYVGIGLLITEVDLA
jgi:hypothetical protein